MSTVTTICTLHALHSLHYHHVTWRLVKGSGWTNHVVMCRTFASSSNMRHISNFHLPLTYPYNTPKFPVIAIGMVKFAQPTKSKHLGKYGQFCGLFTGRFS